MSTTTMVELLSECPNTLLLVNKYEFFSSKYIIIIWVHVLLKSLNFFLVGGGEVKN